MPKTRRRASQDLLSRKIAIASCRASVSLRTVHHRGEDPEIESGPWLELRGQIVEPVRGITDICLSMHPKDMVEIGTARPASIGAILQLRPALDVVIAWPHREFDRVWNLALMGHLKFAHLAFTEPHRNKSLVVNAYFSSEEEDE